MKTYYLLIVALLALTGCKQFSSWTPGGLSGLVKQNKMAGSRGGQDPLGWKSAQPPETLRAEIVSLQPTAQTLASCAPDVKQWADHVSNHSVRLASTSTSHTMPTITHIDRRALHDFADLASYLDASATEDTAGHSRVIQVDFQHSNLQHSNSQHSHSQHSHSQHTGQSDRAVTATKMTGDQIAILAHQIAPDLVPIRYQANQRSWVHFRDQDIRLRFQTRVSPEHGMIHLILGVQNHGVNEKLLPANIQVVVNDSPTSCLSAAEVLERIYGEPQRRSAGEKDFATASESSRYLVPSNFDKLAESYEGMDESESFPAMLPEITQPYPGPAILGDARALSGLLMQRHLLKPGREELSGWVVFGTQPFDSNSEIVLKIDLGNGQRIIPLEIMAK